MTEIDRTAIDIAGLLTIDVTSELRKLTQAQLQGPWQLPTEFVRRALRSGATEVDVRFSRGRATIVDDGDGISPKMLGLTATLLDEKRPNAERHEALIGLETMGELALFATAGLQSRGGRITSRQGGATTVLELGGLPHVNSRTGDGRGNEVVLSGNGLDRRACHDWLVDAARFASATIRVDGKLLTHGFAAALAQTTLTPPLVGRLAIPIAGDTAHTWLLEHGIVTGHVALPEAPCFEAAIELGTATSDGNAARLRELLQPHVATLIDQAVHAMLRVGSQAAGLPEHARARIARLLLQAARKQLRTEEVMRTPVFRAIDSNGEGLTDLATLMAVSERDPSGPHLLQGLYPGQRVDRHTIGELPVVVADEVERALLAELLRIRFRPPDIRDTRTSFSAAVRRGADALAHGTAHLFARLRHPLQPPVIGEEGWTAAERVLLEALRDQLARDPQRGVDNIALCQGAGPIRRAGGATGPLLLPRANPTVAACVAAVDRDRSWIYPAYLALLDGYGRPPEDLRRIWLTGR